MPTILYKFNRFQFEDGRWVKHAQLAVSEGARWTYFPAGSWGLLPHVVQATWLVDDPVIDANIVDCAL